MKFIGHLSFSSRCCWCQRLLSLWVVVTLFRGYQLAWLWWEQTLMPKSCEVWIYCRPSRESTGTKDSGGAPRKVAWHGWSPPVCTTAEQPWKRFTSGFIMQELLCSSVEGHSSLGEDRNRAQTVPALPFLPRNILFPAHLTVIFENQRKATGQRGQFKANRRTGPALLAQFPTSVAAGACRQHPLHSVLAGFLHISVSLFEGVLAQTGL